MKNQFHLYALFFLLMSGGAYAADAADKSDEPHAITGAHPNGIFAMPGKDCPPGSHVYQGPEQIDIAKVGSVYCVFDRRYIWFDATDKLKKCPDGKPFVTPGIKDPARVWCDMPTGSFTSDGTFIDRTKDQIIISKSATPVLTNKGLVDPAKAAADPKSVGTVLSAPAIPPSPADIMKGAPSPAGPGNPTPPPAVPAEAAPAAAPLPIGTASAPLETPPSLPAPADGAAPAAPKPPEAKSKSWFHW